MNLDQEKRVMLAFALSIVMLILYRVYFVKEPPPEPKKAAPAAATTPAAQPGAPKATTTGAPATRPPRRLLPWHYRYRKALSPKKSWWKASSTA